MSTRFASLLSLAVAASAVCFFSAPASAAVASRCDRDGCARIVCHDNGNRCYRQDEDRYGYRDDRDDYNSYDRDGYDRAVYEGYERDDYDRYRGGSGWRYDCDRDADNCQVQRERYDDR